MRPGTARAAWVGPALAALLAGALTGCGSHSTPAAEVPALQGRLDAVDRAVSGGQPAAVRRAVGRLERAAHDAERSGDLGSADAAAIVSAGDALLAALPARRPPSSTTSPTPTPTPAPTPTPSEEHPEAPEPPGHDKPEKEPKPPKPGPPKPPKGPGHDHGHGH